MKYRNVFIQLTCWLVLFIPYIFSELLPCVATLLYYDAACRTEEILAFMEFIF